MEKKGQEQLKLACSRGNLSDTLFLTGKKSAKYIRENQRVSETDGEETDPDAR